MKENDLDDKELNEQVVKRNRIAEAFERERSRLANPIQIQYAKQTTSLEDVLVRLNFSEDFIARFNKLSIQQRLQNS